MPKDFDVKYIGFYIFAFFLPLPLPLIVSAILMGGIVINSFFLLKKKVRFDFFSIICILFFLTDLLSLTLSGREMEKNVIFNDTKLSFLILPFLLFNIKEHLSGIKKQVTLFFILGTIVYILYAWLYLIFYVSFWANIEIDQFSLMNVLKKEMPGSYHHTYIGSYIVFSGLMLLLNLIYKKGKTKWVLIGLYFFLFTSLIYIGSKLSILLMIIFSFWIIIFSKGLTQKTFYSIIGSLTLCGILLYTIRDFLIYRLIGQSFDHRLIYFKESLNIIKQNFLFGIGDESINEVFFKIGENYVRLIPHNMYLKELLSNGIIGFVILIILFFFLVYTSVKLKNKERLLLCFLVMSYGMIEDYIYLQRGVFFFLFFSLLFSSNKDVWSNLSFKSSELKK